METMVVTEDAGVNNSKLKLVPLNLYCTNGTDVNFIVFLI